eukprot:GHVN01023255.1.p1 GENE.GHVN01023255.1~~GHVN01023255.1.p1  ORF type:complete len:634 (+),score=76.57 GHVN01023255.1:205-2106(+)
MVAGEPNEQLSGISTHSRRLILANKASWVDHWLVSDSFKALVGMQLAFCLSSFVIGNLTAGFLTLFTFAFGITASITRNYSLHLLNAGVQLVSWVLLVIGMVTGFGSMSTWHVNEQYLAIGIFQLLSALAFASISVVTVVAVKIEGGGPEEQPPISQVDVDAAGVAGVSRDVPAVINVSNGQQERVESWCVNMEIGSQEQSNAKETREGVRDSANASDELERGQETPRSANQSPLQLRVNGLTKPVQKGSRSYDVKGASYLQVGEIERNADDPELAMVTKRISPSPSATERSSKSDPHRSSDEHALTAERLCKYYGAEPTPYESTMKDQPVGRGRNTLISPTVSPMSNVSLSTVRGGPYQNGPPDYTMGSVETSELATDGAGERQQRASSFASSITTMDTMGRATIHEGDHEHVSSHREEGKPKVGDPSHPQLISSKGRSGSLSMGLHQQDGDNNVPLGAVRAGSPPTLPTNWMHGFIGRSRSRRNHYEDHDGEKTPPMVTSASTTEDKTSPTNQTSAGKPKMVLTTRSSSSTTVKVVPGQQITGGRRNTVEALHTFIDYEHDDDERNLRSVSQPNTPQPGEQTPFAAASFVKEFIRAATEANLDPAKDKDMLTDGLPGGGERGQEYHEDQTD